ncbi:hypothetical protein HQ560_01020 [bacterium]|nr:hypothetical protein [bacterium]
MARIAYPFALLLFCWGALFANSASGAEAKGPSKLELSGAEHRMASLEKKVVRMHGQPFKLGYTDRQALERVNALYGKHPEHPKVKALFERARQALLASKGKTAEVKKDWLAYRENEKKLKALFLATAEKEWQAFREKTLTPEKTLAKAFPPPDYRQVSHKALADRYVVLDAFEYPTNEFTTMGSQFCSVGSGARGYYYVELSNRRWLGAYEAVKRYRRFVNRDVPEGMKWTLVGKITGIELLVPQAGKKKTFNAHWGWRVEPVAIWVPDRTFAVADASLELGGTFAGEDRVEEIKGPLYTVKEIPPDVTPKRLVEIFVAAIQDKNYKLYTECIDPARRKGAYGRDMLMYHWEWHQRRFATLYCRVTVNEPKITIIQGFDDANSLERDFLTKEDRAKLKKHAMPLVKWAEMTTVAYDERGRQYGSPKPRFLKKVEDGRWYITNYKQPF